MRNFPYISSRLSRWAFQVDGIHKYQEARACFSPLSESSQHLHKAIYKPFVSHLAKWWWYLMLLYTMGFSQFFLARRPLCDALLIHFLEKKLSFDGLLYLFARPFKSFLGCWRNKRHRLQQLANLERSGILYFGQRILFWLHAAVFKREKKKKQVFRCIISIAKSWKSKEEKLNFLFSSISSKSSRTL